MAASGFSLTTRDFCSMSGSLESASVCVCVVFFCCFFRKGARADWGLVSCLRGEIGAALCTERVDVLCASHIVVRNDVSQFGIFSVHWCFPFLFISGAVVNCGCSVYSGFWALLVAYLLLLHFNSCTLTPPLPPPPPTPLSA